jgi:hypothetical protein
MKKDTADMFKIRTFAAHEWQTSRNLQLRTRPFLSPPHSRPGGVTGAGKVL